MTGQRLANAIVLAGIVLIASCSTAHAEGRIFAASELAVVIGHAVDLGSTQNCLGAGRCREVNPRLARYESPVTFAVAKFGVVGVQLWIVRKMKKEHPKLAAVTNFTIGSGFIALGMRNARVGRTAQ